MRKITYLAIFLIQAFGLSAMAQDEIPYEVPFSANDTLLGRNRENTKELRVKLWTCKNDSKQYGLMYTALVRNGTVSTQLVGFCPSNVSNSIQSCRSAKGLDVVICNNEAVDAFHMPEAYKVPVPKDNGEIIPPPPPGPPPGRSTPVDPPTPTPTVVSPPTPTATVESQPPSVTPGEGFGDLIAD